MVNEGLGEAMERWLVGNKQQAEFFMRYVMKEAEEGREKYYTIVNANRTNKQNNTLQLLFRRMAEALNDAGFEIPHPFKPDLEIPYTESSIRELIYKPIIKAMFDADSSTTLTTTQFSEAMTTMVDAVCRNTGVNVPIPSQEFTNAPS